ncbi:MAG: hypothetical protein RIE08_14750 [Acidimicrobiales bacterium]
MSRRTPRRRIPVALSLLVVLALIVASCGDDSTTETEAQGDADETALDDGGAASEGAASDDTTGEPLVEVTRSSLGDILSSGGFALYLFTPDPPGETTCFDSCAGLWPPLEGDGTVEVGAGLDAERFGLIDRGDGTMQVTYDGTPLYFYAPDSPGTTDGQGLNEVWFVVDADGAAVTSTAGGGSGPGY